MSYTDKAAKAVRQVETFCYQRWIRSIGYIKRKFEEYKTKRQNEPPQDKYSRRTAHATIAMAFFTFVLIGVGYIQFVEIRDSGIESSGQTNQMLALYRQQVAQLSKQANDTHDLAVRTKELAEQAVKQTKATQETAKTSRDALIVVQRAFVFPDAGQEPALRQNDGSPPTIIFPIPFENSGSTPTKNMTMHINWAYVIQGSPEPPFDDVKVNGVVPPNTDVVMGPRSKGYGLEAVVPQDMVKLAFKNPTLKIRIWGWAIYRDVFDKTPWHLTEYCYVTRFSGKADSDLPDAVAFDNCSTHNCSDEQCKDYDPKGRTKPN